MTRLKKLFPLSFAFSKNPLKLFLGILIYLVANAVVIGVLDSILSALLAPLMIFFIPYVGWILFALLAIPVIMYVTVLNYVFTYAIALINIYTYAGIVVSFVAYAKYEEPVAEVAAPAEEVVADVEAVEAE